MKQILGSLPEKPGSYQYWDKDGVIIYVGKAKNLKRRVSSYFNKNQESLKTRILVSKICNITYTTVNSEEDALNLENELIKKYRPRYNVLLKDDKSYPYIAIQNAEFPKVFKTHQQTEKGALYYGPYTRIATLNTLLELIHKTYPLRSCRLNLTEKEISEGKFKVCLEYHMGNCKGPCIGEQTRGEYMQNISEIKEILKGNTRELEKRLLEEMQSLAEELRFEEAAKTKEKYLQLRNYNARSEVVNLSIDNVDVFSIEEDESDSTAYINFMHVKSGAINQSFTIEYKKKLDESTEELLLLGIVELRHRFQSKAREIILPFQPEMDLEGISITVPQKGDKKKLLSLSQMNVKEYKIEKLKRAEKLNPEQRQTRLLKELQDKLHLENLPKRIECFDNSNIQGSDAVAGCVVYTMGKPDRKEYRKYNIKTVVGADDYASMKEVVTRRYLRIQEEGTEMPDLIIADGGIGQMHAIKEALSEIGIGIPVAGLAKNDRHRTSELLFGDPEQVIGMKQESLLFKLLTNIQDEVHRYAITFHKQKRSKRQIQSELDGIKGIGPKTKDLLLKHYKSVKRIKAADKDELKELIGTAKAEIIMSYITENK